MSNHTGSKLPFPAIPGTNTLIADKGYDSDEFRDALEAKGINPCIPPRRNRRRVIHFDKVLYEQRHKIENMFGRLKDWRRLNPLRQVCTHLLLSHLHRCNRHLLALINEA